MAHHPADPIKLDALAALDDPMLDGWYEEWQARIERENRAHALRRNNPYLLHIIKVLWPRDTHGLRRVDVTERVCAIRSASGLQMPKKFENTVQSAFNQYNALLSVFKNRGGTPEEEELFYPVGCKGSGIWAVRRDRAAAWLLKHEFEV